jgi:hypothetical protein
MLAKKFFHAFRVAHHDARDCRVGGFGNAHGHDMRVVGVEQFHNVEQGADFVREKDGKLRDERSVNFGGCFR